MVEDRPTDAPPTLNRARIEEMIAGCLGADRVPRRFKIITDTTDFFRVEYNDVLVLAGRPYLIWGYAREGRFGMDDEPKYWVRRAQDLVDGSSKIIKLVFYERIEAKVGDVVFQCVRSPLKEGRILDLVKGDLRFMQGIWIDDAAGNNVRILDFIRGPRLDDLVGKLNAAGHEEYFAEHLPALLKIFVELVEGIKFLHDNGQKHGDIRRDHILFDREAERYRWIDFDYDYWHPASLFGYDIFGLGNILIYLVAGGDVTSQQLIKDEFPNVSRLSDDDMNIIFNNRVANLRKIYPYIPNPLNYILLHFSRGTNIFYETADQLLADLREVVG